MSIAQVASANDWKAINLELIAFTTEPAAGMTQQWMEMLIGDPGESLRKRNERIDTGSYQGASMRLGIDLLRIRWSVGPTTEVDPSEGLVAPPDIGAFGVGIEWFSPLMERWFELCPEITRLAFIAKAVQWTESREASYQTLGRYLHAVDVDPASTEFQYRINRKRSTEFGGGMLINRLCTWSSIKFGLQMEMSTGGSAPRTQKNEFDGCLLQMDLNTPHDRTEPLRREDVPLIWRELVKMGIEIAEYGDVR